MEKIQGKSVVRGVAMGPIAWTKKTPELVARKKITDVDAQIERYERAKKQALEELAALYDKALREVGEVNAHIFEVHSMLLQDDDFNDSVVNMIRSQQVNAEYAVAATGDNFANLFENMEDEYFQARSADIKDVSGKVLAMLTGVKKSRQFVKPSIVMAEDLAPSETMQMDKSKMLGFVTTYGSVNSHTAILARMMQIPALTGIAIREEWEQKMAIVDGFQGVLILDPDRETIAHYQKILQQEKEHRTLLEQYKNKPTRTKSGKSIPLYANIGNTADLPMVLENDAEGIGLFRSEFLYLERDTYPTEEEQFRVYKQVAETMAGKRVIIRTLDIGADKQAEYFGLDKEENPAMGLRGIRICLTRPQLFRTQLRAIYRASAYGNLSIMYPMITSLEEVRQIRQISRDVRRELSESGIDLGEVEEGIMIETPGAAMISDLLAKEVDFFSIGTNDLTQYALAIDRQNNHLDSFYNPHHQGVLRMVEMIIQNAHREGKWCGICGELGADTAYTETFVKWGVDELSVAPGAILGLRKVICDIS